MVPSSLRYFALAASLLLLAENCNAFWRLPCNNRLTIERIDPIVSPGAVSGHVHTISGGSGVALNSTFEQMRAADCTSCMVSQDMSAYWTPALYFHWANGSFTLVNQVGAGLIYYLQRYNEADTTEILAFPDGLRMLTGNPALRSYNASSPAALNIHWSCLNSVTIPTNPYLPPSNCDQGLRGEVMFPSCWDGVNIDSADHFSHMAYPIGGESGPCPDTHPKRIVTLFYEMMWDVNSWNSYRSQGMNATQPFVLANGDPTGYGYHGDFLDGWDGAVLQEAIRTCTDDSGVIQNCPVFDLQSTDAICQKTPDVNEIVTGTLDALPGCNPVTPGPDTAVSCKAATTPSTFANPVAYTGLAAPPGAQVLANTPTVLETFGEWQYQDCYSDNVANRALINGLSTVNSTIEACLDACMSGNYMLCGIEYHGQCWGANTLTGGSAALGYGACGLTCDDNPLQYCGGYSPTAMELYARGAFNTVTSTPVTTATTSSSVATVSATVTTSTIVTSSISTSSASATTKASSSSIKVSSSASMASSSVKASSSASMASSSVKVSSSASMASSSVKVSSSSSKASVTSSMTASASSSSSSAITGKLTNDPSWTYSGCFSDLVGGGRSLPNMLTSNSTIEGCLAASTAAGFAVAALSYKGECWAAPALSPLSSPLPAAQCDMACTSSPSETCGGAAALDVYISKVMPLVKYPTTPNLAFVSGYSFTGCYSDAVSSRALPTGLRSNSTIEGCIAACSAANLTVCGLEYYGECWGASSLASTSQAIASSNCLYACKNNPLENCGGSNALSVYTLAPTKRSLSQSLKRHKSRLHF